jgi:hypothetical protein
VSEALLTDRYGRLEDPVDLSAHRAELGAADESASAGNR